MVDDVTLQLQVLLPCQLLIYSVYQGFSSLVLVCTADDNIYSSLNVVTQLLVKERP